MVGWQDELRADDGMQSLRDRVHFIRSTNSTHEDRGSKLHELMTKSYRTSKMDAASDKKTKALLPETVFVAPRIEELPVELIEHIAINLSLRDFGTFRLSSPVLKAKSSHYFRRRFFTHRSIKLDWESLRNLVNNLNHAEFGPALQDLAVISLEGLAPHASVQQRRLPLLARRLPAVTPAAASNGHLSVLMDRVFGRINRLRSLSFVRNVSSNDNVDNEIQDRRTPRLALSRPHERVGTTLSAETLSMVLAALAQGSAQIEQLKLGVHKSSSDDCSFFVLYNMPTEALVSHRNGLRRAFQTVTSLDLVLYVDSPNGQRMYGEAEQSAEFPLRLFTLTPNLNTLNLHFEANHNNDTVAIFEDMSGNTRLPNLSTCTLQGIRKNIKILEAFLSSSTKLKELHIINGTLATYHKKDITAFLESTSSIQRCTMLGMSYLKPNKPLKQYHDMLWQRSQGGWSLSG